MALCAEAIRLKAEKTKHKLETAAHKLAKDTLLVEHNRRIFSSKYSKKKEMEEWVQELIGQARLDAEKKHAECHQQMADLRVQLETAHANDRADLLRKIEELQRLKFDVRGGLFGTIGNMIDGLLPFAL